MRQKERGGEAAGARRRGMGGRHAHPCLPPAKWLCGLFWTKVVRFG